MSHHGREDERETEEEIYARGYRAGYNCGRELHHNAERKAFIRKFVIQNRHALDGRGEGFAYFLSDKDCVLGAIEAWDAIEARA